MEKDNQTTMNELEQFLGQTQPQTQTQEQPQQTTQTTQTMQTEQTQVQQPAPVTTVESQGSEMSTTTAETNPTNVAFATMRTENKKYKQLIEQAGAALGVQDPKDIDAITNLLNQKAIEQRATELNVPPAIMQQLEQQNQIIQQIHQENLKTQMFSAFDKLKTDLSLTNEQTIQFAQELSNRGVDVAGKLDQLDVLYKGMHYNDLVQSAITTAVNEALQRGNAAQQFGATLSTQQGTGAQQGTDKITTVTGLGALLADAPKF